MEDVLIDIVSVCQCQKYMGKSLIMVGQCQWVFPWYLWTMMVFTRVPGYLLTNVVVDGNLYDILFDAATVVHAKFAYWKWFSLRFHVFIFEAIFFSLTFDRFCFILFQCQLVFFMFAFNGSPVESPPRHQLEMLEGSPTKKHVANESDAAKSDLQTPKKRRNTCGIAGGTAA